jgi:hypothetical protein
VKVIQIAVTPDSDGAYDTLFALRDDGSIWYLVTPTTSDGIWVRLPDISDASQRDSIETGERQ